MAKLVEVIFKGEYTMVDLSFLQELVERANEVRFNVPESSDKLSYEEIVNTVKLNSYVDLAVSTSNLMVREKRVTNVFVNVGRDGEKVDILFFFDLEDLGFDSIQANLTYLRHWMVDIKSKYKFEYFVCQMDAAAQGEYYFDSSGWSEQKG